MWVLSPREIPVEKTQTLHTWDYNHTYDMVVARSTQIGICVRGPVQDPFVVLALFGHQIRVWRKSNLATPTAGMLMHAPTVPACSCNFILLQTRADYPQGNPQGPQSMAQLSLASLQIYPQACSHTLAIYHAHAALHGWIAMQLAAVLTSGKQGVVAL